MCTKIWITESMGKGEIGYIDGYVMYNTCPCAVVVVGNEIKFAPIKSLIILKQSKMKAILSFLRSLYHRENRPTRRYKSGKRKTI